MDARLAKKMINHQFYRNAVGTHPKLARGQVWCKKCGATQKVNAAHTMRSGWPKCCGHTMTIDSPEERKK